MMENFPDAFFSSSHFIDILLLSELEMYVEHLPPPPLRQLGVFQVNEDITLEYWENYIMYIFPIKEKTCVWHINL